MERRPSPWGRRATFAWAAGSRGRIPAEIGQRGHTGVIDDSDALVVEAVRTKAPDEAVDFRQPCQ
jgi:hypothetical protein